MSNLDPFELCGSTIDGKYRVLSVVGQGGFGVVYLVRQPFVNDNRPIVVGNANSGASRPLLR